MDRFWCELCKKTMEIPFFNSKCEKSPEGIHVVFEKATMIKRNVFLSTYWCRKCIKNLKVPTRIDDRHDPFEPTYVDALKCPQCNNINCLEMEHFKGKG